MAAKGKPVSADPVNYGRAGGQATVRTHRDDPDYFRRIGRMGGAAKARRHSAAAKAAVDAALEAEPGDG